MCAANHHDSLITTEQHKTDHKSSSYTSAKVQVFSSHTQTEFILMVKAKLLGGPGRSSSHPSRLDHGNDLMHVAESNKTQL